MRLLRKILAGLCLMMCIMSVDMSVSAKNNEVVYSTLDEIPENLEIFDTILKGSLTAIEKDGEWYYRFRRKAYQDVLIKVSAFMTQPKNKYLVKDNSSLKVDSIRELKNMLSHLYGKINMSKFYIQMCRVLILNSKNKDTPSEMQLLKSLHLCGVSLFPCNRVRNRH